MSKTAILGLQWGDEGKGKIIDCLTKNYNLIIRFQGGNNAGHTIVNGDTTYKLNHIPSGILHENKTVLLGTGMVIELEALFDEIQKLQNTGIRIHSENLKIADNATLVLPFYKTADTLLETLKGNDKIGTTQKGIGIAYQDKTARRALRVGDIFENKSLLENKILQILTFYEPLFKAHNKALPTLTDTINFLYLYKEKIQPHLVAPYAFLQNTEGLSILFEGAQGALLDITWGTYPFVTSSNTHAAQIFLGSGIGLGKIDKTIGVLKAYTTRVGAGPFFTEDTGQLGSTLQEKGAEFGTVTGRKRRCGAIDLVAAKYACTLSGISEIALTKLDVLDTLDTIPICIGYLLFGKKINHIPTLQSEQNAIAPIYTTLKGWKTDTTQITNYNDLPEAAKNYITFLETYLERPIQTISVGWDRQQTIYRN